MKSSSQKKKKKKKKKKSQKADAGSCIQMSTRFIEIFAIALP